jgi:hypothetical protein
LDDAKHSIERDDTYLNGYIRAGKACLGLCLPEDAKGYFSKAQELQPDASVASRGLDDAARLMEEMKIEDGG